MCGYKKIDGYVFCSGIDSLNISYKTRQDLQGLIRSVTYLIREATYRPDYLTDTLGRASLDICPLSGLLDMYHAQKATKRHDKVYALLSMSSDNLRNTGLSPNYTISWKELLKLLLEHLISKRIAVQTCENREAAIIKSKGCILGKVVSVQKDPVRGDRLRVEVALQETLRQPGGVGDWSNYWTLQMSAKTIQHGDFICLLQDASKPAIIRLHKDYFTIIVLEVLFSDETQRRSRSFEWSISLLLKTHPFRDFLLVWDWENSLGDSGDPQEYEAWIRTKDWRLEKIEPGAEGYLAKASRLWNVVLALEDIVPGWADSMEYKEMEERGREVVKKCEMAIEDVRMPAPEIQYDQTPPSWTAQDSYDVVIGLLLTHICTTSKLDDGVSRADPLLWAVQGGHKAVVELLLRTGEIDMNVMTISAFRKWPLYIAVADGHNTIVELLLKLGKLNMRTMNLATSVLLSLAVERGHEDVMRTLLEACLEIFDSGNYFDSSPLWLAAGKGFEDSVRLLLKTAKVEVDARGFNGQTPLSRAAAGGHVGVVKLLLNTDKVDPDSKDDNMQTSLWLAASEGHEMVVKLLLETGKVEVNSTNEYGETPLSRAVLGGHEAVVRLLLETSKVDFKARDRFSLQTPLSLAAERGYEAIVKLMLEKGNFNITLEDGFSHQTPLLRAVIGGHEAVVRLLIEVEGVEVGRRGRGR
jgi:ankyrin repeat protein